MSRPKLEVNQLDEINYVRVDKDILDFLKVIYFGDISDPM